MKLFALLVLFSMYNFETIPTSYEGEQAIKTEEVTQKPRVIVQRVSKKPKIVTERVVGKPRVVYERVTEPTRQRIVVQPY